MLPWCEGDLALPRALRLRRFERLEGGGRAMSTSMSEESAGDDRVLSRGGSLAHTLSSKVHAGRMERVEGEWYQRRRRLEACGRFHVTATGRATRQATQADANAPFITATTKSLPPSNSASIALSPSQSINVFMISRRLLRRPHHQEWNTAASSPRRGSLDNNSHLPHHPERAVRGGTTGTKCLAIL